MENISQKSIRILAAGANATGAYKFILQTVHCLEGLPGTGFIILLFYDPIAPVGEHDPVNSNGIIYPHGGIYRFSVDAPKCKFIHISVRVMPVFDDAVM